VGAALPDHCLCLVIPVGTMPSSGPASACWVQGGADHGWAAVLQAVTFLVIGNKPKKTLDDITRDLCPVLSIQQLYRISTMYWDDKYNTETVSSEVGFPSRQSLGCWTGVHALLMAPNAMSSQACQLAMNTAPTFLPAVQHGPLCDVRVSCCFSGAGPHEAGHGGAQQQRQPQLPAGR